MLPHSAGHAGPFADGHLILCQSSLDQVHILLEQGIGALEQGQRLLSSSSLACSMLLPRVALPGSLPCRLPRMQLLLPWMLLLLPWVVPRALLL